MDYESIGMKVLQTLGCRNVAIPGAQGIELIVLRSATRTDRVVQVSVRRMRVDRRIYTLTLGVGRGEWNWSELEKRVLNSFTVE
jgi:hypothetical protein